MLKNILIFLIGFFLGNATLFISMAFFSINKDEEEKYGSNKK